MFRKIFLLSALVLAFLPSRVDAGAQNKLKTLDAAQTILRKVYAISASGEPDNDRITKQIQEIITQTDDPNVLYYVAEGALAYSSPGQAGDEAVDFPFEIAFGTAIERLGRSGSCAARDNLERMRDSRVLDGDLAETVDDALRMATADCRNK